MSSSGSNMSYEDFETGEKERNKRISAENRVRELESRLASVEPLLKVFEKCKKTKGAKTYPTNTDELILKLLAECRSSSSIHCFFSSLAEQFPFLLKQTGEYVMGVPSVTYIEVSNVYSV